MNKNQPISDATVAQLVAVSLRLAMEVSVLHDRLRSQEALLARAGVLPAGAVDDYLPDAIETAERDVFRRQLVAGLSSDLLPGVLAKT
jgi:hypothetical protein